MGHATLVILGSGYTAKFVWPQASRAYARVFATSRQPNQHLLHVPPEQRIQFDLAQPPTWRNVPQNADLLWCFPAAPVELVQELAAEIQVAARRVVVLGSTSAYDIGASSEYPPALIDETTPIDCTQPRVQGEEYLRSRCNAIVLRVAGIYGPHRNPVDWIKTGRVGPSRKYVNLIHAEDLAAICLAALQHGKPGEAYNVSDGTPRTWQDICDRVQARWGVTSPKPAPSDETGKRISNAKLIKDLGYTIQHPDLFQELSCLG